MTQRLSRRHALGLALVGGLGGLAACATPPTPTEPARPAPPTATQAVAQAPAAPAATPAPTAPTATPAARAAAPSPAPPATGAPAAPILPTAPAPTAAPAPAAPSPATPTGSLAVTLAGAATRFLGSLSEPARAKATYAFGDAERRRWHWTTPAGFPRHGLPLREMNPEQRDLALALLRAGSSEAGHGKLLDIMSLQRDLNNDPELYYVTVFGAPGGPDPWGWRFEGHHISRNVAVVGDRVTMTPFFLGAWPTASRAGLRPMQREEEAPRELARSLEGPRRAAAVFQSRTLTEHVTQNRPRVEPLPPVGIPAGDLGDDQRRLIDEILQAYVGALPVSVGGPLLDRLRGAGAEGVRFGWAGGLEPRQPHYYRLQGPSFLLEFDNSRNGGTHIHSVWRDFAEDFGQHLA
jgi:uncharacterized protein DUF3500